MNATATAGLTLTIAVRDGKLAPTNQQQLAVEGYLRTRSGKEVEVSLSRPVRVRSDRQNRYLWGVIYKILADDTGHTPEDIHAYLKDILLPRKFVTLGGVEREIAKSTKELEPQEFEKYAEQIRAWAASDLGIRIPLPNE
jgi:hypothetical protein